MERFSHRDDGVLIDSVIIKLKRRGADFKPDYSLTIYGYGNLEYVGYDNVGVKGKIDEQIDKDKVLELLKEFKNLDFFSLDDEYPTEGSINVPYNVVSLSLKDENGEIKTKSVLNYEGSRNVPWGLINLENKIDEIAGTEKWVNVPIKVEMKPDLEKEILPPVKTIERKHQVVKKKKPVKLIAGIVVIVVLALLIFFVFNSGLIQFNNNSSSNYNTPNITIASSAGSVNGCSYQEKNNFQQGETVYIYYEFSNVKHDNNFSVEVEVIVNYNEEEVGRYNNEFNRFNEDELFCDSCSFNTDNSWSDGEYIAVVNVEDKISKKSATSQIVFNILNSTSSLLSSSITTEPEYPMGSPPLTVKFYGDATGGTPPYSWEWDFDWEISNFTVDSTEQNPIHTFESSVIDSVEIIYVKLRVTDSTGLIHESPSDFIYLI